MIVMTNWTCLEKFGITVLTGESCQYMQRLLCDLNPRGVAHVCNWLSITPEGLGENWNADGVKSILLDRNIFPALAKFVLLEEGYNVVQTKPETSWDIYGYEQEEHERVQAVYAPDGHLYYKTMKGAGRNQHRMSGRTV